MLCQWREIISWRDPGTMRWPVQLMGASRGHTRTEKMAHVFGEYCKKAGFQVSREVACIFLIKVIFNSILKVVCECVSEGLFVVAKRSREVLCRCMSCCSQSEEFNGVEVVEESWSSRESI